jgi:membrane-associated phospholipid phosphatase
MVQQSNDQGDFVKSERGANSFKERIRSLMLWEIQREQKFILYLQGFRSPFLDFLCGKFFTFLGTHSFFLFFCPPLFWIGDYNLARHLICTICLGVVFVNLFKDYLCLPRPKSPPVFRLCPEQSEYHKREYGFPSSHSANAANASLMFISYLNFSQNFMSSILFLILISLYWISLPLSRVYVGMHSFLDVTGGAVIGSVVSFAYLAAIDLIDRIFLILTPEAMFALVISLYCLMIFLHPNPSNHCPCFEDGICSGAAVAGLSVGVSRQMSAFLGEYSFYFIPPYFRADRDKVFDFPEMFFVVLFGISVIVLWRQFCKKILSPPIEILWKKNNLPLTWYEQNNIKNDEKPFSLRKNSADLFVKTICYFGIGWLASDGVPSLYSLFSGRLFQ